uniref:NADH dehydrogenase subunit 4L n=1 Tax=Syphacia obvelata TaxID=412127 RepID=A0A0U3DZ94_SYPOB|nr:NADH dehydrogenase subunit 4L [Syphacia obvelata]
MFMVIVSMLSLVFKWRRLLFILISFEFILISCFYVFSFSCGSLSMFFFICVSVISSLLGLVIVINSVFMYGNDLTVF